MLELGSFLTANLSVLLGSLSVLHRLSSKRSSLDLMLLLLIRYVIIALLVLVAGLAHALTPLALGALGLVGVATWFATGEQRRLPAFLAATPTLGIPTTVLLGLLGLWFCVMPALLQPYSVDPLSYHLPKVATWIQQGSLLPYPGADIRETFPAGFELLETWWALFFHHDVLIEFAGVEFLALGAAATTALARYAGLGVKASAFAAVFFCLTPALGLQATACMNDGAVTSMQLATLALVAFRAHPALIFTSIAVGFGLKPTYGAVLPGAALLWWRERSSTPLVIERKSWATALAVAAMAIGGFWYAQNAVQHGNPLYPVGSLSTVDRGTPTASGAVLRRVNELAGTAVYDEADHYTVQFILVAGWGVLAFAAGGVGLISTARRSPNLRRLAAAVGLTVLVALLIAPPGSFYLRFILVAPALGAIAAASLGETLPRTIPLLAIAALFTFASMIRPADRMPDPKFQDVPLDATVACLRGTHDDSNGESYLAYGPGFSRKVVYLERAETIEDLMAQLKAQHVGWVFAQARSGDGSLQLRIREAAKQGFLIREPSGLYRVVSP